MKEYNSDPASIEHDLAETRARLSNHLEELTRRLSPGQLVDEALSYVRNGQGAAFARNLGAELRDNPLPVALTGMGLAWLMIASSTASWNGRGSRAVVPYDPARAQDEIADRARRAGEAVKRRADETEEAFRARVQQAMEATKQAMDATRQTAREAGEAVSDAAQRGREFAARAGSGIADAVGDNPLLLGALGMTAGVLLGALLPRTRQEEALLGPAARGLADAAKDTANEVVDRGARAAEAAVSAAYQAASE